MLPDVETFTGSLIFLVALAAGMSRGFSGFGAALIFVPCASALVGPRLASSILLVVDLVFASYLIPSAWRLGDRREVASMLCGAIPGVPLGALALRLASPLTLRWLIEGAAAAMLLLLLSGWRYRGRPRRAVSAAVGGISGLFTGIAQIGGPPVMSYWLGFDTPHARLRANIILYFAGSGLLTLLVYFWSGLISSRTLQYALIAGPSYGVGAFLGSHMFGLASPKVFRASSLALIAASLVVGLPVLR